VYQLRVAVYKLCALTTRSKGRRYRGAPELRRYPLTKAVTDPDLAAAKRAFDAMMQMKKIDIAAIEAARRG